LWIEFNIFRFVLTLVKSNLIRFGLIFFILDLTHIGFIWLWSNRAMLLILDSVWRTKIKPNSTLVFVLTSSTRAHLFLFGLNNFRLGLIKLGGAFILFFLVYYYYSFNNSYMEEDITLFRLHFSSTLDIIRKKTQVRTKFF